MGAPAGAELLLTDSGATLASAAARHRSCGTYTRTDGVAPPTGRDRARLRVELAPAPRGLGDLTLVSVPRRHTIHASRLGDALVRVDLATLTTSRRSLALRGPIRLNRLIAGKQPLNLYPDRLRRLRLEPVGDGRV